jgi:hypothetical protein
MKDALLRSGYLLETRVESTIRQLWGHAIANNTYTDPITGQSREYDIHAMIARQGGPDEHDYLFANLTIECVNNSQPLVIFTKEPLAPFLHHQEIKISGLPVRVQEGGAWKAFSDFLGMETYHHYCAGKVGSQFCSFTQKKGDNEWMATHEGGHFDSFQKLCAVVDHEMELHFGSWKLAPNEHLNIEMHYPVVLLQGDLVEAKQTKRSVTLRHVDHLQFRRSVSSGTWPRHYQIDVIREKFLPTYLGIVEAELAETAKRLNQSKDLVRTE